MITSYEEAMGFIESKAYMVSRIIFQSLQRMSEDERAIFLKGIFTEVFNQGYQCGLGENQRRCKESDLVFTEAEQYIAWACLVTVLEDVHACTDNFTEEQLRTAEGLFKRLGGMTRED